MSHAILKFTAQDVGVKISAQEFASAEFETPFRYERVRGRLLVMSPAGPEHRKVSRPFRLELGAYWGQYRKFVDDVDVEGWVSTSEEDDRIPEICVYLAGSCSQESVPRRIPDLVFEIVSGSRADQERDYIDKREEYHQIGVREYVIVDRFKKSALVLTWQPNEYEERELTSFEAYTTSLLPGLSIPLEECFRD